jgi:hypothetical protein
MGNLEISKRKKKRIDPTSMPVVDPIKFIPNGTGAVMGAGSLRPAKARAGLFQGRCLTWIALPHSKLVILELFIKSGKDGTETPAVSLFTRHTLPCCGHSSHGQGTKHSICTWYRYALAKPASILALSYKNTLCLFFIITKCGCSSLLPIR